MTLRLARVLPALPCLGLLLALPLVASAQGLRNAAVLDLEGRRAATRSARVGVVEGAEPNLALVGVRELRATARREHVELATLSGLRRVAAALELDVVLGGRVEGRGRGARVTLWALDAEGSELATREVPSAGRSAVRAAARSLSEQAVSLLDARDAERRQRRQRRRREEPVARARDERDRADRGANRARPALLAAEAGLGGASRNAAIALAGGGERRYEGGFQPEIVLRAELRPLRSFSPALGGVVLGLDAAYALAARSWSAADERADIETSAWRLSAFAGWLAHAGPVELGPTLGWGTDVFELGDNQVMPSASYEHVRLGGSVRVALLSGLLRLRATAGWRFVLSAGDIVDAFGDRASASGFDVSGGAVLHPVGGLSIGLDLGFARYALSFDGSGEGANATEGTDDRLRAALYVGWSVR